MASQAPDYHPLPLPGVSAIPDGSILCDGVVCRYYYHGKIYDLPTPCPDASCATFSPGSPPNFVPPLVDQAYYPRGTVAMANSGAATNGSQFFFAFRECDIDGLYTPFGTVVSGMDIVDRVAAGGEDDRDRSQPGDGRPRITLTILSFTVQAS